MAVCHQQSPGEEPMQESTRHSIPSCPICDPMAPQPAVPCSNNSPKKDQARRVPACPAQLVAVYGCPGPFLFQKKPFSGEHFFCLCSVISYSSVTSDPAEWSEHFVPPVLQPSLGTSLSLSGKNSPWAFCHTNRLHSHP